MKTRFLLISLTIQLLTAVVAYAQTPAFTARDVKQLTGIWQGTLTYLDYSSGKPYTMPAQVTIQPVSNQQILFLHVYANEPKANGADTVKLSADGRLVNNEQVTNKKCLAGGLTEIVTEYAGKDGNDNKPATIRTTYTFGKTSFTKKKEIQWIGETGWIKRHEYSYTRR